MELPMSKQIRSDVPSVLIDLLNARGIVGEAEQEEFFSPRPQLAYDPFLLANMRTGVDLLLKAIADDRRIVIYGDYDCDGVTSTALLMKVLGALTENLTYYIPSRIDEGYGLNKDAIDKILADGGEVIVTVDCGAVSADEVAYAHEKGLQTVVTDHHTIKDVMAPGIVVNPQAPGDTYPFRGLAGVGVAYKLALALSRRTEIPHSLLTEVLELAAVGTIADVMPLVDENRTIVKYGLRLMRLGCRNKGLSRLIDLAGIRRETMKASDVAFGIAPRINAAGRLGDASLGVRMLLAEDPDEVERCCRALMDANEERRALQEEAFLRCLSAAEEALAAGEEFLLLEATESHEGILGIVAGKIKERVRRPVVLLSRSGDAYKGTGRSVENVDLFQMLNRYRDRFLRFGGHRAACGFTIAAEEVDALRCDLNRDLKELHAEKEDIFAEDLRAEAKLTPAQATPKLAEALELLEPCGAGNEQPLFLFDEVVMEDWRYLKNGTQYAKFRLCEAGRRLDCLLFREAEAHYDRYLRGEKVSVLGTLERNSWQGRERAQVIVRAILPEGERTRG